MLKHSKASERAYVVALLIMTVSFAAGCQLSIIMTACHVFYLASVCVCVCVCVCVRACVWRGVNIVRFNNIM